MNLIVLFLGTFTIALPAVLVAVSFGGAKTNSFDASATAPSAGLRIVDALSAAGVRVSFPMGEYLDANATADTVSKGTPMLSFDLDGPACLSSTTVQPWTTEMRRYPWIVRKYLAGYDAVASEADLWAASATADVELMLGILGMRASRDPRYRDVLGPLARRLQPSLLYRHVKDRAALQGYPPAVQYQYNYTDFFVRQAHDAILAFALYGVPFPFNVTVDDVAAWVPLLHARALSVKGMGRVLCIPLMVLDHSASPDVVLTTGLGGGTVTAAAARTIRKGQRITFDFTTGGAPTVQRSVFRHGGQCSDMDPVDLHFEFAHTPALTSLQCAQRTLSLNLEGQSTDPEHLLMCLVVALRRGLVVAPRRGLVVALRLRLVAADGCDVELVPTRCRGPRGCLLWWCRGGDRRQRWWRRGDDGRGKRRRRQRRRFPREPLVQGGWLWGPRLCAR